MRRNSVQSLLFFLRWQLFPLLLALPAHVGFILRGLGKRRCRLVQRLRLAYHSVNVHLHIECGHNPLEILDVIEEIIELDPSVPGQVIECGVYLGGSAAKISHAVFIGNRKLIVCDSFQGLPPVDSNDFVVKKSEFHQGEYSGTLEKVRDNIRRFGKLEQVEFLPGWYQQSLDQLQEISVACAFWDVDLQASFRACVLGLWRQIIPGSKVFIHDVDRKSVVEVFTDVTWWWENLKTSAPELVGGFKGLVYGRPLLGYVVKDDDI